MLEGVEQCSDLSEKFVVTPQQLKEELQEAVDTSVTRYLSEKHDEIRQLLVRFVRLQFEDLQIGLVVPGLTFRRPVPRHSLGLTQNPSLAGFSSLLAKTERGGVKRYAGIPFTSTSFSNSMWIDLQSK
ncbi:hypothetical protein EYF80_034282 [Liparis tanakae]|uniref:Uncharacterized protein n=1 Tax=Liparis tanakae TaxID=230148 RepID=A0A4Z2GQM3_9TELE|nr:hypothetical protein EYF80_034282 [Liparis tanakae]